jgi:hypothetical protein
MSGSWDAARLTTTGCNCERCAVRRNGQSRPGDGGAIAGLVETRAITKVSTSALGQAESGRQLISDCAAADNC